MDERRGSEKEGAGTDASRPAMSCGKASCWMRVNRVMAIFSACRRKMRERNEVGGVEGRGEGRRREEARWRKG